jgi:hypothetical protein
MRVTKTRVSVVMAVSCFCFGCKGAGEFFKVAAASAVVVTRVAGAVAESAGSSNGGGETPVEAPGAPVVVIPASACVELAPMPEQPGDLVAVRTVDCGGRVIVQDPETGMWRDHR